MSESANQCLSRSDIRRKRKELLLGIEKAHKSDIQTYSSGHLGPYSLKPPHCRPHSCLGSSSPKERRNITDNVQEMMDALYNFTMATTLQVPSIRKTTKSPSKASVNTSKEKPNKMKGLDVYERFLEKSSKAQQGISAASVKVDQGKHWFINSHWTGLTWSDQPYLRQQFKTPVLCTERLITKKCLNSKKTTNELEHKLMQALRKLPATASPCRERLAVLSDVFDDVCDGSSVFSSILREIKTEYDLYLKTLLSSQSCLLNKSDPAGKFIETMELEKAASLVSSLEDKARRALKDNDKLRMEYEDALLKDKRTQKEIDKGSESSGSKLSDLITNDEDRISGEKQCEASEVSSIAYLETMRQEVWRVWMSVQKLQKEIREIMVEIMHFIASNERLRNKNKDLEQNILIILNRANISEETKAQLEEKIWNKLNGED
ncbi:uncharacterized protein C6orf118-like isoform X2 [Trichomycterus rosablanca]|uniref:uncharacterized protein C6orf118-like isoform X2 n=1 Tax=Trichomycterus rosablanca TaxID=2290929 RepID=UPI002F34FD38